MSIAFKPSESKLTNALALTHQHLVRGDAFAHRPHSRSSHGPAALEVAAGQKATAELVLRTFNTWAYKRQQPDHIELMSAQIASAIDAGMPVEFCLYWGKGPRADMALPERDCLDFLKGMADRIQKVHSPGVSFTLIFTDTHAALNGHAREKVTAYFSQIATAASERGFSHCFLSDLVEWAEAQGCQPAPAPLHLVDKLSTMAAKWYRGDDTVEVGALKYLQMNVIEKRAVELVFPKSIFVTFNGGDMRALFPDSMPIFYMYSVRRGISVKPRFMQVPSPLETAMAGLPASIASCGSMP